MFIDDLRAPPDATWIVARSSREALDYMSAHGCPAEMSFDHDLGDDDTAMTIVKYMVEHDLDMGGTFIPESFLFSVHSANPVGARNIKERLQGYLVFRRNTL